MNRTNHAVSAVLALALVLAWGPGAQSPALAQIDFDAFHTHATEGNTDEAILADMNADGHTDVIARGRVFGTGRDGVRVLLADGAGGLRLAGSWVPTERVVDTVSAIAVADLDGDGLPDVVAAVPRRNSIFVLRGDGQGNLDESGEFFAGVAAPERLATGDFDEDGDVDVAVAGSDILNTVSVMFADGSGEFTTSVIRHFGSWINGLLADDLDGDGHLDLVFGDNASIEVHFGDGSGGFSPGTSFEAVVPRSMVLDDWNEDGALDLAIAALQPSGSHLLLGDGAGGFASMIDFDDGVRSYHVSSGDADLDGHVDVFLANYDLEQVAVYLGDGAGGLDAASAVPALPNPHFAALADLDGDDRPDLLSSTWPEWTFRDLRVAQGLGNGEFVDRSSPQFPHSLTKLVVEDMDGDGFQDFVVATLTSQVRVLYTGPSGAIDQDVLAGGATGQSRALRVADLDGDTRPDVVHVGAGSVDVFLGDGGRGFDTVLPLAVAFPTAGVALGNWNDAVDSWPDLILGNSWGSGAEVYLGDGTGRFSPGITIPIGGAPSSVAVDDIDGDGHVDVAMTREATVSITFGNGQGGSNGFESIAYSSAVDLVETGDFDADGRLDLLAASKERELAHISFRNAGRSFADPAEFRIGESRSIVIADFDRNGAEDAALCGVDSGVKLLLGANARERVSVARFALADELIEAAAADSDGDGDVDLFAIERQAMNHVTFLTNRSDDGVICRRGNVNFASGGLADVLHVNGSRGAGPLREISIDSDAPFELRMDAPPSRPAGPSKFALYAYTGDVVPQRVSPQPFSLGVFCAQTPLTHSNPARLRKIWNNIGKPSRLGVPNFPSNPAPIVVLSISDGIGMQLTVFLQGLVIDSASPSGVAAITNGLLVRLE